MGERGTITSKEDFAEEAKYFTESRLLHREVEIILESQSNNNFIGSVLHPVVSFLGKISLGGGVIV